MKNEKAEEVGASAPNRPFGPHTRVAKARSAERATPRGQ
jgi:hypothetical protein